MRQPKKRKRIGRSWTNKERKKHKQREKSYIVCQWDLDPKRRNGREKEGKRKSVGYQWNMNPQREKERFLTQCARICGHLHQCHWFYQSCLVFSSLGCLQTDTSTVSQIFSSYLNSLTKFFKLPQQVHKVFTFLQQFHKVSLVTSTVLQSSLVTSTVSQSLSSYLKSFTKSL